MLSRDVLKEKALAAWKFQPCLTEKEKEANGDWIVHASQRDMEFVVRALQKELYSVPLEDNIFTTIDRNDKNHKITSEGELILQQKMSAEKPPSRKRPRAGRSGKSAVTFVAADRHDFRAVVQHTTGHSVLKPQPKRLCTAMAAPSFACHPQLPLQMPQALKPPSFSYQEPANFENFSHDILFQTPQNYEPIVAGEEIFLELNDIATSGWLNFSQYR